MKPNSCIVRREASEGDASFVSRSALQKQGLTAPSHVKDKASCCADALAFLVSAILGKNVAVEAICQALQPNGEKVSYASWNPFVNDLGYVAELLPGGNAKYKLLRRDEGHYLVYCQVLIDGQWENHYLAFDATKGHFYNNWRYSRMLTIDQDDRAIMNKDDAKNVKEAKKKGKQLFSMRLRECQSRIMYIYKIRVKTGEDHLEAEAKAKRRKKQLKKRKKGALGDLSKANSVYEVVCCILSVALGAVNLALYFLFRIELNNSLESSVAT